MTTLSPATPLEATARWTAAVRARESARADRLFEDPWAAQLCGPEGRAWVDTRSPESVLPIVLRTRYFDDWLQGITADRAIEQVVLLGAGLDTRAYRLSWRDGTAVFELDHAFILRFKAEILERAGATPRCSRRIAPADLRGEWPVALASAGFDGNLPAAWLLEGLLFYLPVGDIERILDLITGLSAPGSRLGFDIVNAAVLTSPWTRPWVEMQAAAGAPWLGTMEDPVHDLAERGWSAALTQAGQPDANHGRWTLPVIPTTMPDVPHSWFVTAIRPG